MKELLIRDFPKFANIGLTWKVPGVGYVAQGREIITYIIVEENLLMRLGALPGRLMKNKRIDFIVYELFQILKEFLQRKGGDLSGGQQQQLTIERALLGKPQRLLLDKPT